MSTRDHQSPATHTSPIECDALVVGAGFSGVAAIHRLRKLGLIVKCFEASNALGGVWNNNIYPGARVDSEAPFYQINIPEVWETWKYTQRFASGNELRRYFEHVDSVLKISKDVYFNAAVCEASWDDDHNLWRVRTKQGHQAVARFIVACTGCLYSTYTPAFSGIERYRGQIIHSGRWDPSFQAWGKSVAIIGAGSTGIQITQEVGKQADRMTVFLRRPSYCLPMQQRQLTDEEQWQTQSYYSALFEAGRNSFTGFPSLRPPHSIFDASEEERTALFERLWRAGGSVFALNNYSEIVFSPVANKLAYDFWAAKVRARIQDAKKREIMAPESAPYYFGTKRVPLEHDYYEVIDQPNVTVHDLSRDPITEFVPDGILTADGEHHAFDAIILATGFDSFTGSLTRMGLSSKNGTDSTGIWQDGDVHTYLGLMVSSFPNLFLSFGPQAPTALSNGPSIIEIQIDLIARIVERMKEDCKTKVEVLPSAEAEWKREIDNLMEGTLFPHTMSWWNRDSPEGKRPVNMLYAGGIARYERECLDKINTWEGFHLQ